MNRPDYTIILSVDSLSASDLELISLLPNFKQYLKTASVCGNVTSVYPSLTYPAHTSIVTGRYPVHHGVINNTLLQPHRNTPDWYWNSSYIEGKTLYDEAMKQGMKVASLLWPVTAGSKIQYNLPEIFPAGKHQSQILLSLKNGSPLYQLKLEMLFGKYRNGISQPQLDKFVQMSLLYTLKKYKPGLTLVHYTDLDKSRHVYGYSAPDVFRSMERMDSYLGEIIFLLKKERMYENTALIILGDHSQIDVHTPVCLNDRFEKDGYLTKSEAGVKDWKIFASPCDGSCYIYLNQWNPALYDEVFEYLHTLQGERKSGIGRIYSGEEARLFGADKNCTFMLEAKIGYYFTNNQFNLKAAHGYLPTIQGYETVFIGAGKGIRKNAEISNVSIVDEAPTIAELLGADLGIVDGRVIQEFLDL